jgi:hypothetical protein
LVHMPSYVLVEVCGDGVKRACIACDGI